MPVVGRQTRQVSFLSCYCFVSSYAYTVELTLPAFLHSLPSEVGNGLLMLKGMVQVDTIEDQ